MSILNNKSVSLVISIAIETASDIYIAFLDVDSNGKYIWLILSIVLVMDWWHLRIEIFSFLIIGKKKIGGQIIVTQYFSYDPGSKWLEKTRIRRIWNRYCRKFHVFVHSYWTFSHGKFSLKHIYIYLWSYTANVYAFRKCEGIARPWK